MEIIHTVSPHIDPERLRVLRDLGIELEILLPHLGNFKVAESDPNWPEVRALIQEWDALDVVDTLFSPAECLSAAYLQMRPTWHQGYPQPENDYLELTYECVCPGCGIREKQLAPFIMKCEPRWGKKHILQLNWVFDEYFVIPEVWESVFKPFGIECMPVLSGRQKTKLATVVQLVISSTRAAQVQMPGDARSECCGICNRIKYCPWVRGPFPMLASRLDAPISMTETYFGSGHSAWNAIIINQDLFRQIDQRNLRGVRFTPLLQ